ncbi:MAG TPA: hypothetical protein P5202_04530 [Methanomassiliicoccales archaeon]|nr:hypothetical protein [Methanomassiliicoccales archaeon]
MMSIDRNGGRSMLGIDDPQIIVGYALAIGLGIFCLAYGILHWNDGGEKDG